VHVSFHCVPFAVFEITLLLEYFLANFRNRRSRTSLRPLTMASSQRTTGTLRIVTLKRIGTSESPAPPSGQTQPHRQEAPDGQYKECARMGTVIRIQDVAFITCVDLKSIFLMSQREKASKRSCSICIPIRSSSHHSDLKKIASQGVPRLPGHQRNKYLNHRQNQSTD
jgi:hypothetical protein